GSAAPVPARRPLRGPIRVQEAPDSSRRSDAELAVSGRASATWAVGMSTFVESGEGVIGPGPLRWMIQRMVISLPKCQRHAHDDGARSTHTRKPPRSTAGVHQLSIQL